MKQEAQKSKLNFQVAVKLDPSYNSMIYMQMNGIFIFGFIILPDNESFLPKSEVAANGKYYTVVVCDKNM
jgi:hypothetical protein